MKCHIIKHPHVTFLVPVVLQIGYLEKFYFSNSTAYTNEPLMKCGIKWRVVLKN